MIEIELKKQDDKYLRVRVIDGNRGSCSTVIGIIKDIDQTIWDNFSCALSHCIAQLSFTLENMSLTKEELINKFEKCNK